MGFILESDSSKRLDLIALTKGDYDEAQTGWLPEGGPDAR